MLFQKGAVPTNFDIYAFITTNFDFRYIYTLSTASPYPILVSFVSV